MIYNNLSPIMRKKETILDNGYIYIIYPLNYNCEDIDSRLFYIGSAEDFEKRKRQHYQDLYNLNNTSKRIVLMRKYMKSYNKNTYEKILDDDKIKCDDNKFWQIKPIFHGINCCTKSLLEALEGLYIYYYYSILNDKGPNNFKFNDITQEQIDYFKYLNIDIHLSNFYKKPNNYYINPYSLIHKDTCDFKPYRHIYKQLCTQPFIPKFNSINDIVKGIVIIKSKEEFNNDFFTNDELPIIKLKVKQPEEPKTDYYVKINDKCYKCFYCDKEYKYLNNYLVKHLSKVHNITVSP